MKKLIALLASVSVIVAMSATSFAAATPSAEGATSYAAATDTTAEAFNVNASTIAADNNQTTIVVIKGEGVETEVDGKTVTTYNISTDTIQYINQSADKTFTLIPKDHDAFKAGAEDVVLTVLVGGDKISKTEAGKIKYTAEVVTPEEPTFMRGDIWVDGEINDDDITALDLYYADLHSEYDEYFGEGNRFWEDETSAGYLGADVFPDGEINDDDITALDLYYADLHSEYDEYFGEGNRFWE